MVVFLLPPQRPPHHLPAAGIGGKLTARTWKRRQHPPLADACPQCSRPLPGFRRLEVKPERRQHRMGPGAAKANVKIGRRRITEGRIAGGKVFVTEVH